MAITTVTNANLADYVTERNQSVNIQNNEQLIAAVEKTGKTAEPVVTTGAETSPDAPTVMRRVKDLQMAVCN